MPLIKAPPGAAQIKVHGRAYPIRIWIIPVYYSYGCSVYPKPKVLPNDTSFAFVVLVDHAV
jgi:hypothetical protein